MLYKIIEGMYANEWVRGLGWVRDEQEPQKLWLQFVGLPGTVVEEDAPFNMVGEYFLAEEWEVEPLSNIIVDFISRDDMPDAHGEVKLNWLPEFVWAATIDEDPDLKLAPWLSLPQIRTLIDELNKVGVLANEYLFYDDDQQAIVLLNNVTGEEKWIVGTRPEGQACLYFPMAFLNWHWERTDIVSKFNKPCTDDDPENGSICVQCELRNSIAHEFDQLFRPAPDTRHDLLWIVNMPDRSARQAVLVTINRLLAEDHLTGSVLVVLEQSSFDPKSTVVVSLNTDEGAMFGNNDVPLAILHELQDAAADYSIDDFFRDMTDTVGRELTDTEREDLFNIYHDYRTPNDEEELLELEDIIDEPEFFVPEAILKDVSKYTLDQFVVAVSHYWMRPLTELETDMVCELYRAALNKIEVVLDDDTDEVRIDNDDINNFLNSL